MRLADHDNIGIAGAWHKCNTRSRRVRDTFVKEGVDEAFAQGEVGLGLWGGEGCIQEGDDVVAQLKVCASVCLVHLHATPLHLLSFAIG